MVLTDDVVRIGIFPYTDAINRILVGDGRAFVDHDAVLPPRQRCLPGS